MGDHYWYNGHLTFKEGTPQELIDEVIEELYESATGWPEKPHLNGRDLDIGNEYSNNNFEEAIEPYLSNFEDSVHPVVCEGPNMDWGVMFQRIRDGKWEYCNPVPGWELDEEKQRAADLLGANIELSAAIEGALHEAEEIERFWPGLFDLNVIFRLQQCLQE